jgi:hypothetical protein
MMKKINIIRGSGSGRHWKQWIKEFAKAGYEIVSGNPMAMELQTIFARPGEIVLFDALLPNLPRFIERTYARCPDAFIVVAHDADELPEELPRSSQAYYISAPLTPADFVKKIRQLHKKITSQ